MKTRNTKLALAFGALVLSTAAIVAVAAPPPSAKRMPNYQQIGLTPGKPGGTLTLAIGSAPQTFMYYGAIDAAGQRVAQHMFDGLIESNLATGRIEPALAESWTISPDGRVYTFKLRQGVKWHDGVEFTADDVVFTYDQIIANPEAKGGDFANFSSGGTKFKFEKVDKYTVRFTLPFSSGAFLVQMRSFIMPKHKLEKFTVEGGGKAADINNAWGTNADLKDIVGTGPYELTSYTPNQKVTLTKNPDYWKVDSRGTQLPYIDKLELLVLVGPQAQEAAFKNGTLDALDISGAQFPDYKAQERAGAKLAVVSQLKDAIYGSPPHLAFNQDAANANLNRLFDNYKFREAMQFAVNRQRIINDVYNGQAQLPGHMGVPPAGRFYQNTRAALGEFSLARANAALDALGLRDTDGDGVRNFAGGGPDIEFSLTYGTDSAVFPAMATIFQNDFKAVGIKVNLKGVLSSTLLSTGLGKDWETIIVALGDQPDPELRKPIWQPGGSLYYWHQSTRPTTAGGPANFAAMTSWERRLYEIFDKGTKSSNQNERLALYREGQSLLAKYMPVIMIAKPANITVVRDTLSNFVYTLGVIPGYNPVPFYYFK
jgi:peptide/nickel transport system substrate-binding protein